MEIRPLLEFILAAALLAAGVVVQILRPQWLKRADSLYQSIASRRKLAIAGIFLLTIAVRGGMLPVYPKPYPWIHDEFVHLLIADTLVEGRLSNPPHPFAPHFEVPIVLHQNSPAYTGAFAPGTAMVFAAGTKLFGHPWFGTLVAAAVMSACTLWMLYCWLPPAWALTGGIIAAVNLGIFGQWTNSYLGGHVQAAGGALMFGVMGRMFQSKPVPIWLLPVGWAMVILPRAYEGAVLGLLVAAVLLLRRPRVPVLRLTLWTTPVAIAVAAFLLYYNSAITGNPLEHPYHVIQKTQGVPQTFYWQKPLPKPPLDDEILNQVYDSQLDIRLHRSLAKRLELVLGIVRQVVLDWALLIPLVMLPLVLRRDRDLRWMLGVFAGCVAAALLYPFFFAHYFGAFASLALMLAMASLCELGRFRFGRVIAASLVAWSLLAGSRTLGPWMLKPRVLQPRESIEARMLAGPGKDLVFVRYEPGHSWHQEWRYNRARIDDAEIVWAREINPESDRRLMEYFRDRNVWRVNADTLAVEQVRATMRER